MFFLLNGFFKNQGSRPADTIVAQKRKKVKQEKRKRKNDAEKKKMQRVKDNAEKNTQSTKISISIITKTL